MTAVNFQAAAHNQQTERPCQISEPLGARLRRRSRVRARGVAPPPKEGITASCTSGRYRTDWAGPPKSGLCSVTLPAMGGGGVSGAARSKEAQKDRLFLPGQSRRTLACKQVLPFVFARPRRYLSGH